MIYLFLYQSLPDWNMLTVDNLYHHNWAQSIASGNVFGDTTYFRAPFYIYCLAFLYKIFGSGLIVARLFGLALGLLSILMTYLIASKFLKRRTAVLAALIQTFYPIVNYFESELLLDSLFMVLLQIAVYMFLRWKEYRLWEYITGSGIALGLAVVTRPTGLLLLPIFIGGIFYILSGQKYIRNFILFIMPVVLIVG